MLYAVIGILAFDLGFVLGCAWRWLQTRGESRPVSTAQEESSEEEVLYVG
ncbi:MAG: hypothetical protein QJR03_15845 [Sphaerobacter sp.]|nr:hypothetical protein [Sphaerobacter sp.]